MATQPSRLTALLSHPSPALRYLVLTRLASTWADAAEIQELETLRTDDPYVSDLERLQRDDGGFRSLPQGSTLSQTFTTAYALSIYAFLGFDAGHAPTAAAAEHLLSLQDADGEWPMPRDRADGTGYDSVPLQSAIPLRGLCAVGLSGEPAVERGLRNLLDQRLPDGAWPTGRAQGALGYVAGYRRLPQSRWGCRSNTTGAVAALSGHPDLAESDEARRGLDHLLARESEDEAPVGYEACRLSGYREVTGFITHFAQFDAAFLLHLAARCGASPDDSRVAALVERLSAPERAFATDRVHPAAAAWVTYDIECSCAELTGAWVGSQIHTPYSSYPRDPRRY